MKNVSVVIDNDSLIHLTAIETKMPIIGLLRNIFSSIHVPEEVCKEYQDGAKREPDKTNRRKILEQLDRSNGFFKKCTTFDTISKVFLETWKGIDKGEAAVAAQYQKIGARFIISEDGNFHKELSKLYPHIKMIKLKHVLAILDVHGYINWQPYLKELHQTRKIKNQEVREAYLYASVLYEKVIDKKTLSKKCSFKKIGII